MLDATLNQALETERIAVQAALGIKLFQMENTLKAERFQIEALLRQHMEQFELSKNQLLALTQGQQQRTS